MKIDSAPQGATIYIGDKACGAVGVTPWSGKLPNGTLHGDHRGTGLRAGNPDVQRRASSTSVQELFVPLVKKAEPPRIDVRADADKNVFGASVRSTVSRRVRSRCC